MRCRLLGIDRGRFYRWRRDREQVIRRVADEAHLAGLIAEIHAESGGTYGAARVTAALHRQGLVVNRKRVAWIMREHGIRGQTRRKRRLLIRPDGKAPTAPDLLLRHFTAPTPGQRFVGDITCLATSEGWVYLAVLIDLCTRMVVSWATAARQSTALAITVLHAAQESGNLAVHGIVHTDRGSQYTARAYRQQLARLDARQSLSRTGSCLDNAAAESFFASLKTEIDTCLWATRQAAIRAADHWIGVFYNTQRLHSTLGYRTPAEAHAHYAHAS